VNAQMRTIVLVIRSMVRWIRGAIVGAVDWLRAGYSDAATPPGYCSLVALHGPRSITKHQVAQVLHDLSASTTAPTVTDIRAAIVKVTDRLPNPDQVSQVRRGLGP
jgi:hypothetical protein